MAENKIFINEQDLKRAAQALEAFRTLGVALADHSHQWTKHERWLYGRAYGWLISVCGVGSGA